MAGTKAPLPSPAAPRRPALYELLARRVRDPRYQRPAQPDLYQRSRLEPALSVPDAHGPADPARADGAQDRGRHRRGGLGPADAVAERLYVDRRYHRREAPGAGRDMAGAA